MRPMFTVHAGEFIFAEEVERRSSNLLLWIPTKDTGVDFLVTDCDRTSNIAVQVKMSRDYRPLVASNKFEESLEAGGWFVFSAKKLQASKADIWSLIVVSHERRNRPFFVNISPRKLLQKLRSVHGEQASYNLYIWVLSDKRCIEGRRLGKSDRAKIALGSFDFGDRDLTEFLDDWRFVDSLGGTCGAVR